MELMYRGPVRRLLWAVTMGSFAVCLVCFLRPSSVLELTVARPSQGRGTWGPVYFLRLAGWALARGGDLPPAGIVGGSGPPLCPRRPATTGGASAGQFLPTRVFVRCRSLTVTCL